MTDIFSREKRSEIMSKIRSKWTGPEKRFMEAHPDAIPHPDWLPYRPDFILDGKIVYLDSSFWHGFVPRRRFEKMPPYWREKLFRNIVRDAIADSFWEAVSNIVGIECERRLER